MIRRFLIVMLGLCVKKKKLPRAEIFGAYTIEEAKPRDVGFVYDRIAEESKAGHFNDNAHKEELRKGMLFQIFCTIHLQKMPNIQGGQCSSIISIIKDKEKPVGFFWCREFQESGDSSWELYLISVHVKYRGNGLGRKGVEYMLKLIDPSLDIYVRLYSNVPNKPMVKILQSLNFNISNMSNSYMITDVYKRAARKNRGNSITS